MRIGDSLGRAPGDEQSPATTPIEGCRPEAVPAGSVAVRDESAVPGLSRPSFPVRRRRRALLTMALFLGVWALLTAFAGSASAEEHHPGPRVLPTSAVEHSQG